MREMEVNKYEIIAAMDKYATLYRGSPEDVAEGRRIAQQVSNKLYGTPGIEKELYRYLTYNLQYLYNPTDLHIVITYIDTPEPMTVDTILNSKNCAGSEEALLRIALALVKLGCRVTICCKVPYFHGCTLAGTNPRFYPIEGYKGLDVGRVDAVLAWRRVDVYRLSYFADDAPVFFCPHDWYTPMDEQQLRFLRGCIYLTDYQKNSFLEHHPRMKEIPTAIGGNGCIPEEHGLSQEEVISGKSIDEGERVKTRIPYRCIFASSYPRGLLGVLNVWKDIRAAYPTATLHVCYGREAFGIGSPEEMAKIIAKLEELKDEGVEEAGRLPQAEVAKAMNNASYIVNTSKFMETYGIVFVKAMASGCIPVITDSVDPTIVPKEIERLKRDSETLEEDFKTALLAMMEKESKGELEELRKICREYVLTNHTWDISAKKILDFIKDNI